MTIPWKLPAAALLLLGAATSPAAAWDKGPSSPEDRVTEQPSVHVRYPGDVAYPFGTVHVRGKRKIPYVERCFWTYRFGEGLKQTCVRYTPENTK